MRLIPACVRDERDMTQSILQVSELTTHLGRSDNPVRAVDGISFDIRPGETLALLGESGCGKSMTALSLLRLLPASGRIVRGRVVFDGQDLLKLPESRMRSIRGGGISMVFQEPMTALNPVHRIGRQIMEALKLHKDMNDAECLAAAIEMLEKVGIPSPEIRISEYPHQLSGGMRQRVMIAMALICNPALIIADEPTTALDVTIQAQILDLLQEMQDHYQASIIMITHDLGVIAETCDDVLVMYAGRVAEQGSVDEVFNAPRHPYTQGLLESIPRLTTPRKSRLQTIEGMVPALTEMPVGCRFNNRCPHATDLCREQYPALDGTPGEHRTACHLWQDLNK